MNTKLIFTALISVICLSITSTRLQAQQLKKKWYPGHYLYASPESFTEPINESNRNLVKDNPYFTGYHVRYFWSALETGKGVYDFSIIEQDLATARADGKKLGIFIMDRDHSAITVPVPNYLTEDSIYEGGYYRGFDEGAGKYKYLPSLWVLPVADRMGELFKAIGARFDEDTCIAFVNIPETSLIASKQQEGFSATKLKDGYKAIYSAAAEAFPNTIFSQYANYPGGLTKEGIDEIMLHLASLGHGFGGPDALNTSRTPYFGALKNSFGSYYNQYRDIVTITSGAQSPSYAAGNPLMVLNYAIDSLNAHFMSWVPVKKRDGNAYGIHEVIEMINTEKGRINTTPPGNLLRSTDYLKSSSFRAYTVNNTLRMKGVSPGNRIEVYNLSGTLLISYKADSDHFETELSKGFYLVRAGNESLKAVVF